MEEGQARAQVPVSKKEVPACSDMRLAECPRASDGDADDPILEKADKTGLERQIREMNEKLLEMRELLHNLNMLQT